MNVFDMITSSQRGQLWGDICSRCGVKKKCYGDGFETPVECYPCDDCYFICCADGEVSGSEFVEADNE